MTGRVTDWDAYYDRPAPTAHLTRRYTEHWLKRTIGRFAPQPGPWSIIELGGGNSFCCQTLIRALPIGRYDIADKNEKSIELFRSKMAGAKVASTAVRADLLSETPEIERADIVFSVGLVEHFTPEGSRIVGGRHFDLVRPGGLVIITAPTPTLPYRLTRSLAEMCGIWAFPDERPMTYAEVESLGDGRGRILTRQTLWPLILTQRAVAWRAI